MGINNFIKGAAAFFIFFFAICNGGEDKEKKVIKVGHFPNITHAQGVIGHHLTREGKGWFEERLGPDIKIEWYVYNAGPSAMEGILTDSLDLTFVGPSPTINAFVKAKGKEMHVICGACSGGAALVVQGDGTIKDVQDFKDKKIGTPQFGNTQDIACRAWLISKGFKITLTGGDVLVVPTPSADQLILFKKKVLAAVWTIEPWVSRLVEELQGVVFLDESTLWPDTGGKYVTTHLVASHDFLKQHADIAKKWVAAQMELTHWIKEHPAEAKKMVQQELKAETKVSLSDKIIDRAWEHIEFTNDPVEKSLLRNGEEAYKLGFLREEPHLEGLYELSFLKEAGGR